MEARRRHGQLAGPRFSEGKPAPHVAGVAATTAVVVSGIVSMFVAVIVIAIVIRTPRLAASDL
eukprot:gene6340-12655_t